MRITFIVPKLGTSGGFRVVAVYADRLTRRGHKVTVVSVPPARPNILRRLAQWVQGRRSISAAIEPKRPYFDELGISVHVLDSMRPVVDSDLPDADIVVATWWETAEWVSKLSSRKGKKIYFIQHHEVFPNLPLERCRATYSLPLHKIVISFWLRDLMRFQYHASTVDLVPNGVDTEQFFSPVREKQTFPTVGFLYSTVDFKGVDVLLAALNEIKRQLPNLRAVAFGSDDISPVLPLPDWVKYHYQPPQREIRLIYGACDLWLCASRSEGFHLPPLEAMACRCPVVSTRVGGPLDTIDDGVNGFLVEVGDFRGLADKALMVLLSDETTWLQMSNAAVSTASRFSWDDATVRLERAFANLLVQK